MGNFQLERYLSCSPLPPELQHNIRTIFLAISPSRQVEILNNWDTYLSRILEIEKVSQEKRAEAVQETLSRIYHIVDDAILRDKALQAKNQAQAEQDQKDTRATELYEQERQRKIMSQKMAAFGRPPF